MTAGAGEDSAAVPASPAGQPVPRAPLRDTGPFSAPARTNTGQRRQSGPKVEEPMPGPIRGSGARHVRLPRTRLGWGRCRRWRDPTPIPGHPRSGSMQAGRQETATLKSDGTGRSCLSHPRDAGGPVFTNQVRVPRRPASPSPARPPASPDARSRRRVGLSPSRAAPARAAAGAPDRRRCRRR